MIKARLGEENYSRVKNFLILVASNLFVALLGFFTTVKIANTLGAEEFGRLAFSLAIGGIIAVNVRFGMDRSLIRELAGETRIRLEVLFSSVVIRATVFLIQLFALWLWLRMFADGSRLTMDLLLIIIATAILPLQLSNMFDVWELQGLHALYFVLERLTYFALIWLIALHPDLQLTIFFIGASMVLSTTLFLYLQYKFVWIKLRSSRAHLTLGGVKSCITRLLTGNIWLWLSSLSVLGLTAFNNVILQHFSGFAELGVFTASFQFASIATLLLKNIARIGRPILAKIILIESESRQVITRALSVYVTLAFIPVFAIALPAAIFPDKLLSLFFSSEYASGSSVLRVLCAYLLFRVLDTILGQFLVITRQDRAVFRVSVIAGIIGILMSFTLVPVFGAVGAATALLIGEIFIAVSYSRATCCELKARA